MLEIDPTQSHLRTVRVPDLIADAFGVTKSEARRLLKQGAVKIDGEKWDHLTACPDDFVGKVLQVGKRRFVRIIDPGVTA